MLVDIREELKAVLEGIGYTVQDSEILSEKDMLKWVTQLKPTDYPFCTISFGDGEDLKKSDSQSVGYVYVLEDFNINTVYYASREELPDIREAETRKIRDAIYDYLLDDTRLACDWTIDRFRRAFLPSVRQDQKPAGGLGIKTKIKYRIKERSNVV